MARRQVYHDEELLQWYENAIKQENVRRANKGLVALSELDLLRIVLARYAGLPVTHDVDLGLVRGSKDGFWTPPKAAKKTSTSDMTTPPHGGRAKKAPAKRTAKKAPAKQADMTTPPHGGRSKAAAKKAPAKRTTKKGTTSTMWTPPHGG